MDANAKTPTEKKTRDLLVKATPATYYRLELLVARDKLAGNRHQTKMAVIERALVELLDREGIEVAAVSK